MSQNAPFQTILDALLNDGNTFPARYLYRFSDLSPADLELLLKVWPQVSSPRKQTLLEDLLDLAETDTLISFDNVARPLLLDPDAPVRLQAIRLLWEGEDVKLIPTYLEMLESDEDLQVRAAAARALGLFVYLGELEKIPAATLRKIEDHLLKAAASAGQPLVRRQALEALGYSGREEVIPLIEAAYREKRTEWVVSALSAMGHSNDERWKKYVLSQLRAPHEDVRAQAVQAAGELELTSARPILLDMLEDEEDLDVRHGLVRALAKIGGEGVRDRLEELLEVEADEEEAEYLEEALDALFFTEDMGEFDLFNIDPDSNLREEDLDEKDE